MIRNIIYTLNEVMDDSGMVLNRKIIIFLLNKYKEYDYISKI